jgi:hypothetical protein
MSEPVNKHLEIKDLPPVETLTPEEMERLAGAGRFRPGIEALEAREMMDAGGIGGLALPVTPPQAAQVRVAPVQPAVNGVTIQNGVADITQAAKGLVELEIKERLPTWFRTPYGDAALGDARRDSVTLNRLTMDQHGKFNGQLTVTYSSSLGKIDIKANITNNQLSLDTDNQRVKQGAKLDQMAKDLQPKVAQAADSIRPLLLALYFPTAGSSTATR